MNNTKFLVKSLLILIIFLSPTSSWAMEGKDDIEEGGGTVKKKKSSVNKRTKQKKINKKKNQEEKVESSSSNSSDEAQDSPEKEKKINVSSIKSIVEEVEEEKDEKHLKKYNTNKEYRIHQKAHEKFFKRKPKKDEIIERLEKFKKEYEKYGTTKETPKPINLEGISPRSRILLFREISEEIRKKQKDPNYFENIVSVNKLTKKSISKLTLKFDVAYQYQEVKFSIRYSSTPQQPSNLVALGLPEYKNIYDTFYLVAQGVKPKKSFNDEVGILFDLEIARRVPNAVGPYDTLPVASAIVRHSKHDLIKTDPGLLFKTDGIDNPSPKTNYPWGKFNPFQGTLERREAAIKNIIEQEKASSAEDVHQEYLEFFRGESESSGDEYSGEYSDE